MSDKFDSSAPITKRIGQNIIWLLLDKVIRVSLTLLVTIFIARYLGPEQFGVLNFILALVAVYSMIASFGLQGPVVRDLVRMRQSNNDTLSAALLIKLTSAAVMYMLLLLTIGILRPEGDVARIGVAILGTTLLFKCSDIYKYWFESHILSKYTVWAENLAFFLSALIKLLLVYFHVPLLGFVVMAAIEALLVAMLLRWFYHKQRHDRAFSWNVSKATIIRLLHDSWPLVISGVAWILYMRLDQIMLAQLANNTAVGLYSTAVRISEVSHFVPGVLAFSVMPAILPLLTQKPELYHYRLQQLFDATVVLMFAFAVSVTLLAPWIIPTFFGKVYQEAAEVLVIHVWCGIFSAFAGVSGRHLINIGCQKVLMQRNLLGLMINVPLNFLLIPSYGAVGAAWGSLIVVICVNYMFDIFHPQLRQLFVQKTKALLFVNLVSNTRELYGFINLGKNK